ncbi:hypothetical protein ABPG75_012679 [Micractinium tetrahymenae]
MPTASEQPPADGSAPSRSQPPPTVYRSPAGEAELRALYDKVLASLPFPHEERLVQTASFGTVLVMAAGPEGTTPLVIWHGMGAPSPFMLDFFKPLVESGRFRVYCADFPAQAGSRSEDPVEHEAFNHDTGRWCLEVLQALKLAGRDAPSGPPPLHIGLSFGGATLLDLAVVAPESIRAAALVVPGGLLAMDGWGVMLKVLLPSLLYRLLPCRWTGRLAMSPMVDEPDRDMSFILLSWRHIVRYPQLPGGQGGFTSKQLRNFRAPALVIAAEHDCFWPGKATAAAAERSLPGCRTVVLPGAKHLPAQHHMEGTNKRLLGFFEEVVSGKARPRDVPAAPLAAEE